MKVDLPTFDTLTHNDHDIVLRPIKPEDAEKWYQFILGCSKHSIYTRYNLAKEFTEEEIMVHCDIDPEKQIAYVAELNYEKIIGEVRLYIFEDDPEKAEFVILVTDDWQSKGIGTKITEKILKIGKEKGIKKIIAFTESDNFKMLKIFKKLGFDKTSNKLGQTVDLMKLMEI